MKTLKRVFTALAALCCFGTAWAAFERTNPVTGETETYTWKFAGTDTWNGTGNWQDSNGDNPSGTPAKTGNNTWEPILFDNKDPGKTISINAGMSVEGWDLRMGLYNGASVQMNNLQKLQGDTTMWMTVDETSQLTVGGFSNGNIVDNQVINLYVAKTDGIKWNVNLASGNANNTFEYYLKGNGSVSYQAVSAANHKIKQADITLAIPSAGKTVRAKTLVSFTSSSKTFTADATIKRFNYDGSAVENVTLSEVKTSKTLTTDDDVGTCELVQTSTGILLYYVDYGRSSINVNFTNGNGLTTSDNVGLTGYEVPGTAWNNFTVANSTFSTVKAISATGVVSTSPDVSVQISGTRGSYQCSNLAPASNPLHGYIDEANDNMTPTVTVEGVPYAKYRVIVYHSTDSENVPFGYDTINGTNYTYVNGKLSEGTTAWGNSGASNNANTISEGGNTLVTGELSGSTLTVVGHRAGGNDSARGCIAAIQIVDAYDPSAVEATVVDSDGTYVIEAGLTENVKIVCDGSFTITGTENYTVTETDLLKLDLDGVTGEVKLGANTCYTLEADRALPSEYKFSKGSTVVITETREEYAKDTFKATGLTGVSHVRIARFDGTTDTVEVADGVATRGDGTDVKIDGRATIYDLTFANNAVDEGHSGYHTYQGYFTYTCGTGQLNYANDAAFNNDDWDETTGLYLRCSPYIDSAQSVFNALGDFTTVVVGQMSPTHNTIFLHLGSCNSNDGNGLLIATTEEDNKVIIAKNTGTSVDAVNGVKASVPNAATARHAYVIIKRGSVFTVWVDGTKRGSIDVGDNFQLGTSGHSGLQVGSHFGGNGLGETWKSVANNESETGVVNVIRVFDYAISDVQAEAIVNAYPYESEGGLYKRTVDGNADFSAEGAWKDTDDTTYEVPVSAAEGYNPSATITVDSDSTLTVNVDDVTLEKLTIGGSGTLTFDGDYSVKVADSAIVNSPAVVKYGTLDLSGVPIQLGSAGSITFDCSQFNVSSIYATKRYQLTGNIEQDDNKVAIIEPTASALGRTVTSGYNSTGSCYELVITVDHEAGSDVYYTSGYFGTTESSFAVTNSAGSATAVFPGDTVVIPEYTSGSAYFGATLPANVSAIRVEGDFTFEPGVSDQILDGTTVTVSEGKTLTFGATWHGLNLGDVTLNGPGAVTIDGSKSSNATDVDAGTFRISGAIAGSATITIAAGKAVTAESTSSVANAIVLEAGATLTVPATSQITPTTSVDNCTVTSTDNGDGTKVWSVVEERCSIAVTCGENGSIDISYYDTSSSTWLAAEDDYVPKDAEIKVSVTPDLGYKIDLVEVYMGGLDITESLDPQEENNITTATFTVTEDTTISITFAIKAVSFTVAAVDNTTVKVMEGYTQIYPDKDGVYTVQPQAFVTVSWEADGNFVVTNGQKEWFTPTAGQVIAAPEEISVVPAVAKVTTSQTDKLYATLQEALNAATTNDKVTLLDNVELTSTIAINTSHTYEIDLNGFDISAVNCRAIWLQSGYITITGEGTISATTDENNNTTVFSEDSSVIRVGGTSSSSAFLTLGEDVTVETDYCYGITYFGNGGQTVIINGTVETTSDRPAISGNGLSSGSTMLTVGVTATISSTKTYAIYNPQSGTTSIYGTIVGVGGIEAKSGLVYVYSGASVTATAEAQGHDPSGNGTSTTGYAIASLYCGGNYNGAGYVSVEEGALVSGKVVTFQDGGASMSPATLTVAPSVAEMVAIEDNQYWDNLMVTSVSLKDKPTVAVVDGVNYWDFDTALAAAVAGNKTLTLQADLAITKTIEIDGSMTLNLNNYTITATGCRAIWVKAGTVVVNGGDMNMGTIKATGITDDGKSIIRVGSDIAETDFTLARGVTVCNEMGDNFYGITYFGTKPQTVTISGYVQVYGSQPALSGNGHAKYAATTLVVDGDIQAWDNNTLGTLGIYNPQTGTTVIRKNGEGLGGSIGGGIEVKSGTVTIEEGVSIYTSAIKSHVPCSDGPSTAGYGIAVVDNASYKDHPPVVNVKFGNSAVTYVSSMIVLSENNSTTIGQLNVKCEESQLSSLTIADGLEWKEIVGEYNYTLKVVVPGIDPTDPESTQEVVIDPAGKTEDQIVEEVIESATVAVPADVANWVEADVYKTYFNYTVTPSATKPNTYEVAVALVNDLNEEVVLPAEVTVGATTITQAEELLDAATSEVLSATVPAVPGIYYSMVAADNLGFDEAVEGTQTLAMGNTVMITKPTNLPKGNAVFFRVKASATPNN